jgi:predicted nuclease of predicted toxin-antitoxin system
MAGSLRFHLDESLSPMVARAARLKGIDITDSHSQKMLSQSDRTQWEFCQQDGRVMVTSDADFLRLAAEDPDHCGILFCITNRIGQIVRYLELLTKDVPPDGMRTRTDYVR